MPAVSIVVPCYNAAGFIGEGLASVQAQTFADWECLVVDDCSTDGSAALVRDLAARDPRIMPIQLPRNGGASAARNAGLDAASAPLVTLLDADDAYAPDRLAKLVALIEGAGADMVFDNQAIADFPSLTQVDTAFHWLTRDRVAVTGEEFFARSAAFGRSINPGYMKPMFTRAFIQAIGLRYDLEFRSGQDWLLYANAFAHNPKCFATAYCGYVYRRRSGSLSRSGGQHLRNHARLSDVIASRYPEALSPASKAALVRRKAYFTRNAALCELRVALKEDGVGAGVAAAFRHPQVFAAALNAVKRRALHKR